MSRPATVLYAHNSSLAGRTGIEREDPCLVGRADEPRTGYRFHTEVYGTGTRAGHAWDGDLILKGFGDPTLSTADLDRLAGTIAGRGIRAISGRILGDESFYDSKRGAAGWKHVLHRRRDAAALRARRRPRTRLARALAAAARRADVSRGPCPSRRRGRRAARPRASRRRTAITLASDVSDSARGRSSAT